MDNLSLYTPLELKEGNWVIARTGLEVKKSVFKKTELNKKLTNYTLNYQKDAEKLKRLDD